MAGSRGLGEPTTGPGNTDVWPIGAIPCRTLRLGPNPNWRLGILKGSLWVVACLQRPPAVDPSSSPGGTERDCPLKPETLSVTRLKAMVPSPAFRCSIDGATGVQRSECSLEDMELASSLHVNRCRRRFCASIECSKAISDTRSLLHETRCEFWVLATPGRFRKLSCVNFGFPRVVDSCVSHFIRHVVASQVLWFEYSCVRTAVWLKTL